VQHNTGGVTARPLYCVQQTRLDTNAGVFRILFTGFRNGVKTRSQILKFISLLFATKILPNHLPNRNRDIQCEQAGEISGPAGPIRLLFYFIQEKSYEELKVAPCRQPCKRPA
jgi:hypothetical protein